jgi:hypothetical protein
VNRRRLSDIKVEHTDLCVRPEAYRKAASQQTDIRPLGKEIDLANSLLSAIDGSHISCRDNKQSHIKSVL